MPGLACMTALSHLCGLRLPCLIALAAMAACSSAEVMQHARFDAEDRTITAPPGSDYLLGGLKEELRNHGFTVVVAPGWARSAGSASDTPPIYQSQTRYRLYLEQRWRDFCLTGGHRVDVDLTVFDHRLGREMLHIAGRDCTPEVIEKFRNALAGR